MGGIANISTGELVLAQLLTLACLALLGMAFFLRRIKSRNTNLSDRLLQLAALNRSTVALLGRTLTRPAAQPNANSDTISPNAFLTQWLSDTEAYLQMHNSDTAPPTQADPPTLQSAKLRYQLLLTEQTLFQQTEAPLAEQATAQFWLNHSEAITPVIEGLIAEDPTNLNGGENNDELHEQLAALRGIIQNQTIEIQNLKAKLKGKELYKESVLDCWGGKNLHFDQTFNRMVKSLRQGYNPAEIQKLITQIFNTVGDIGEAISGERIKLKPFDLSEGLDPRSQPSSGRVIHKEDSIKEKTQALANKNTSTGLRRTLDKDVDKMKTVIIKQKNVITDLRTRISELETNFNPRLKQEYEQQCIQLEQLLNENDTCIQTLESQLDKAQEKIGTLEEELLEALEILTDYQSGDSESIRKLTQEQLAMLEEQRSKLQSQQNR